MVEIIRDGKVIRRSKNLRGLISHAYRVGVQRASVIASPQVSINSGALVYVAFRDGSECRTQFASFTIARDFVRSRWRKWGLYAEVRCSDTFWEFIPSAFTRNDNRDASNGRIPYTRERRHN